MGGNKGFGAVPKGQKFKPGTIKRLMSYLKEYKVRLTVVVICILISAGASVAASLFLQTLIDDYIGPLLLEAPPNFGGPAAGHTGNFCSISCRYPGFSLLRQDYGGYRTEYSEEYQR